MANKKKLTKKLVKKITDLIKGGETNITAICSAVGISRRVWYKWEADENSLFAAVTRARAKQSEMETEEMVTESKKSLLLLLHGFFLTTIQEHTNYSRSGKPITEYIVTQTHVPPDTKTIIFILSNIDSANFANRLHRYVNLKMRNINRIAARAGGVIQPSDKVGAGLLQGTGKLTNKRVRSGHGMETKADY
jgi:hypothetical protein